MTLETGETATLHRLLAARDPAVLDYLYPYARLLEVVLARRFGPLLDEEDRRDIVVDALIRASQTGDRFDPRLSSLKTWLIMVTVYQAREFLRRHGAGSISLECVDTDALMREEAPVVDAQQPSAKLRRLLDQLPPRRARIVELHYYEGRPVVEIGQMLKISEAAVQSHLSHGRTSLRRAIEAELLAV